MLNPPDAFSEDDLRLLLANNWGLTAARLEYVPVGFGSHHWSVRDSRGGRWFVNVDELAAFPLATDDPLRSLRNALSVPRALVDHGHRLTVAPERTGDGAVLAELGEQGFGQHGFAVSVYRQLAPTAPDRLGQRADRAAGARPVELRARRAAVPRALPAALGPLGDRRRPGPVRGPAHRRRQRAGHLDQPRGLPRRAGNYRR
ncbi:hypothetical protein [Catenulispora pinisilvae]|uniref:hypothetical protein n=1 Tax=Catenulispora pinisilvae TaxID=2705253 RepID=UPI0018921DA2|nr:hypothetical protein [Catenulispora pinisilvae]